MIAYEIPELYKALALAYEKASSDESWRIVYTRIKELVSRIENLISRSEPIGSDVEPRLRTYSVRILKAVEDGDAASAIEIYRELDRTLRGIESRVTSAYIHVILARITATIITMGVGIVLALKLLDLNILIPALLALLSIGVGLGSLLLVARRNAHMVLSFSALLQLGALTLYAFNDIRGAISQSWVTLISLTSIIALIGVHLLAKRITLESSNVHREGTSLNITT